MNAIYIVLSVAAGSAALAVFAASFTVYALEAYARRHHHAEARDYPNGMTRTEWIAAMKAKVSAARENS